ncbi:hypothetical protein GXN76_10395 [Kroppenstedtia pulmonis]|uniref:Uncharacterized protein n=1 Tax=Kroppenstedtia pulmonis TaxID=1380685 RepID=A0A7D4CNI3_9BACL|nr:hypothetical protein [Kroppenstedtia pulmonis]QKG84838.1 hypothetical protein GXN76_10395 [Kroppenstedtia pulmonis]
MEDQAKSYRLVNLQNRSDILDKISQAEQEISQVLDGQVALIAYIRDMEKD